MRLRFSRGPVVWRLYDQGVWSSSVFVVTFAAGRVMTVHEFARFSVAMALGFVCIAPLRSLAVTSRIVVGSKFGYSPEEAVDTRHALRATAPAIAISSLLVSSFLWKGWTSSDWLVVFAVVGMCVADVPRQLLIARRHFRLSGVLATGYLTSCLVLVAAPSLLLGAHQLWVLGGWLVGVLACALAGWTLARAKPSEIVSGRAWRYTAPRMAFEALYMAATSQYAMLLSYWAGLASLTAGLRLAYSLVFAPLFMAVQGMEPLLLQRLARDRGSQTPGSRRLVALWCAVISVTFCLVGAAAWAVFDRSSSPVFRSAATAVAPVGLMILGSQWLVAVGHFRRVFGDPAVMHRLTLSATLFEVVGLTFGWAVASGTGVVVAIVGVAVIKLGVSGFFLWSPKGMMDRSLMHVQTSAEWVDQ